MDNQVQISRGIPYVALEPFNSTQIMIIAHGYGRAGGATTPLFRALARLNNHIRTQNPMSVLGSVHTICYRDHQSICISNNLFLAVNNTPLSPDVRNTQKQEDSSKGESSSSSSSNVTDEFYSIQKMFLTQFVRPFRPTEFPSNEEIRICDMLPYHNCLYNLIKFWIDKNTTNQQSYLQDERIDLSILILLSSICRPVSGELWFEDYRTLTKLWFDGVIPYTPWYHGRNLEDDDADFGRTIKAINDAGFATVDSQIGKYEIKEEYSTRTARVRRGLYYD